MPRLLCALMVSLTLSTSASHAVEDDNSRRPSRGRYKYLISGDPKTIRLVHYSIAAVLGLATLGGLICMVVDTREALGLRPRKPWDS